MAVARYKVEPYVVAGDVYSQPPHVGRGGWTWYTGSAGWLYRVGLESILGFRTTGDRPDPRSLHPAGVDRLSNHVPVRVHDLPDRRRESQGIGARGRRSLARRRAPRQHPDLPRR